MAGDLQTMRSRIAAELRRSDLVSNPAASPNDFVTLAIMDAIAAYQTERFRFSDVDPANPDTFNTVVNRDVYDSNDSAIIGSMHKVDRVYILIGNANQVITVEQPKVLRLYNQQALMVGQPTWYAMEDDKMILSPIPSSVWQVTIEAFRDVAAPASDSEANNPWMTKAERLIRARAKYEIATNVLRNPDLAMTFSPDPPAPGQKAGEAYRHWKQLKGDTNRITSMGRIRPMPF